MDEKEILSTDFSFMKEMNGKTYNEIVVERPILSKYLKALLPVKYENSVMSILEDDTETLSLHEEIIPALYTANGQIAIVEEEGKLFLAYYDDQRKLHKFFDDELQLPIPLVAFVEDWN